MSRRRSGPVEGWTRPINLTSFPAARLGRPLEGGCLGYEIRHGGRRRRRSSFSQWRPSLAAASTARSRTRTYYAPCFGRGCAGARSTAAEPSRPIVVSENWRSSGLLPLVGRMRRSPAGDRRQPRAGGAEGRAPKLARARQHPANGQGGNRPRRSGRDARRSPAGARVCVVQFIKIREVKVGRKETVGRQLASTAGRRRGFNVALKPTSTSRASLFGPPRACWPRGSWPEGDALAGRRATTRLLDEDAVSDSMGVDRKSTAVVRRSGRASKRPRPVVTGRNAAAQG